MPARRTPLWHDLRGRTMYRTFGALILDELLLGSDLSAAEVLRRLRKELHRPMSRQTLAAWRRGDQAVSVEVMLAIGAIVRRTLADASVTVAMKVIGDQAADPDFARTLRHYYGHGRAEIPP